MHVPLLTNATSPTRYALGHKKITYFSIVISMSSTKIKIIHLQYDKRKKTSHLTYMQRLFSYFRVENTSKSQPQKTLTLTSSSVPSLRVKTTLSTPIL